MGAVEILVIGDPHFKKNNSFDTDAFVNAMRLVLAMRAWEAIIVLGDCLHTFSTVQTPVLCRLNEFIQLLTEHTHCVYLMMGNHDLVNNQAYLSNIHAYNAYKKWPKVVVVDSLLETTIGQARFAMAPYVPPGRFFEAIESVDLSATHVMCAHGEFAQVQFEHGQRSSSSDVWPKNTPCLLLNGHIHMHQVVQPNFVCVGAPYQINSTDPVSQGVLHLTIDETVTWKMIPLEGILSKRIMQLNAVEFIKHLDIICTPDRHPDRHPDLIKYEIRDTTDVLNALFAQPRVRHLLRQGYRVKRVDVVQRHHKHSDTDVSKKTTKTIERYHQKVQLALDANPHLNKVYQLVQRYRH